MDISNFEKKHVKEATALALSNYYDERQYVKELPQAYSDGSQRTDDRLILHTHSV